jgi:hypothetical protein
MYYACRGCLLTNGQVVGSRLMLVKYKLGSVRRQVLGLFQGLALCAHVAATAMMKT